MYSVRNKLQNILQLTVKINVRYIIFTIASSFRGIGNISLSNKIQYLPNVM